MDLVALFLAIRMYVPSDTGKLHCVLGYTSYRDGRHDTTLIFRFSPLVFLSGLLVAWGGYHNNAVTGRVVYTDSVLHCMTQLPQYRVAHHS